MEVRGDRCRENSCEGSRRREEGRESRELPLNPPVQLPKLASIEDRYKEHRGWWGSISFPAGAAVYRVQKINERALPRSLCAASTRTGSRTVPKRITPKQASSKIRSGWPFLRSLGGQPEEEMRTPLQTSESCLCPRCWPRNISYTSACARRGLKTMPTRVNCPVEEGQGRMGEVLGG